MLIAFLSEKGGFMADRQLSEYLRQWLARGYTLEQMKNHLIKYGYQERDIQRAYNALFPKKFLWFSKKEEKYPLPAFGQKEVIDAVHPLPQQPLPRQRTYAPPIQQPPAYQQPRHAPPYQRAQRYQPLQQQQQHVIIHKNTFIIAASAFVFLFGIVLVSYLLFFKTELETPSQLLDVRTDPVTREVQPGEKLLLTTKITNQGKQRRFDVTVSYTMTHLISEKVLYHNQLSVAVETVKDHVEEVEIPKNAELGDYLLKTVVRYSGQKEPLIAQNYIKVYQTSSTPTCFDNVKNQGESQVDCGGPCMACPTCTDRIQNQGEEGVDCGGPCSQQCEREVIPQPTPSKESCFDSIRNQDEEGVDCGGSCRPCTSLANEDMTPRQILLNIRTIARENPNKAADYCNRIEDSYKKDTCFNSIADEVKQKEYCSMIADSNLKQSCLWPFLVNNENQNCDELEGTMRSTCKLMKDVSLMKDIAEGRKSQEELAARLNLSLNVSVINVPRFTQDEYNFTVQNLVLFDYTFRATSQYGKPIIYSDNSEDVNIDPKTGRIAFTPLQQKIYSFTIFADDTEGIGEAKVNIHAKGANVPPIMEPLDVQTAVVGVPFEFQVRASDPNGDILRYSDNTDLFDIDPATGFISFTPTLAQVNTHYITVTVTDGEMYDDKTMKLNIVPEMNLPPSFTHLENISAFVGAPVYIELTASDPEGKALSYTDNSPYFNIQTQNNKGIIDTQFTRVIHDTATITVSDGVNEVNAQIQIDVS